MDRNQSGLLQTEIGFSLPKGYLDENGALHRRGTMRLATAADEILPLRDPRVQANPAYLTVIILARVITRLGDVTHIDTQVIENLFACDIEHLRRLYEEFNSVEETDNLPEPAAIAAVKARTGASNGALPVLGEA